MRFLLSIFFVLFFSLQVNAQNRTGLNSGVGWGDVSTPSGAPWSTLSSTRLEFRVSNWSGTGRVLQGGGFIVSLNSSNIQTTSFYDSGTPSVSTSWPSGATDILVRVQRTATQLTTEIWTADGSKYVAGNFASTSASTISLASTTISIGHNGGGAGTGVPAALAWLRLYSTPVALDSEPPNNTQTGDLLNYEFENSAVDTSGRGLNLGLGGSVSYSVSPVVPQVGPALVTRVGSSITPSCAATGADSYKWRAIGNNTIITNATTATPTISGFSAFGEYLFRCTATINGISGTSDLIIGAVPTNPSGVVIPPTDRIGFLLAPVLRSGASPWEFYDKNRTRRSLEIGALVIPAVIADISTPLAGTVSIANGSSSLVGVGTSFLTQYAVGAQITIYHVHADARIGRQTRYVSAIADDTHLTLNVTWPYLTQTGVQHQRFGTGNGDDANGRMLEAYNYYDSVLALYVSYYKTGFSQLATYADQFAALWWLYLDYGKNINFSPRQMSLEGLMIAAERNVVPLADIQAMANLYSWDDPTTIGYRNFIGERNTSTFYNNFYYGVRESGYAWRIGLATGRLHPDSTTRTTWAGRFSANVVNHYYDYQCRSTNPNTGSRCRIPEGAFRDEETPGDGTLRELPWHVGIIMQGLIRYHRWTANSTAATVVNAWTNHMMTNTQPGGVAGGSLYLGSVTGVSGLPCKSHYYSHLWGTTGTISSGVTQGDNCGSDATGMYGSRDINNEIISSYGYAYRLTGTSSIKTRGDEVFGATWGGTEGYSGQWNWSGASNRFKTHGQGLCCNDSYLVDRLGSVDGAIIAAPVNLQIDVRFADIPTTTQVRMTITNPDGTTTTNTCTSTPCTVSADANQGVTTTILVEYLNVSNRVLSSGRVQAIKVQ